MLPFDISDSLIIYPRFASIQLRLTEYRMSFKLDPKNLYRYFFYLFIFAIPLQTRKVILTDFSYYTGAFTESGTMFIYLSDILLVCAILSYAIWNRTRLKKSLRDLGNMNNTKERRIIALIIILGIFHILSAISSQDYFAISLFRSIKMVEMAFLTLFAYLTLRNNSIFHSSLFFIIVTAVIQSIIAIFQFIMQHSLFNMPILHKLTGESVLSPELPGIAKISLNGENLIRAYGTFPHPNILGGFLLFSISISLYTYLRYYPDVLSRLSDCIHFRSKTARTTLASFLFSTAFILQFSALLFTFSRSAWIGAALAPVVLCLLYRKIVSRETISQTLRFKELWAACLVIIAILLLNYGLFINRATQSTSYPQDNHNITLPRNSTLDDRIFFNNVSRETIMTHPVLGSGAGTSIFQIDNFLQQRNIEEPLASWQYQPTHNIYLLIASEVGLMGFIIFCLIIIEILRSATNRIVSRETISDSRLYLSLISSCMIGLLFIGLFDHYLVTQQQGQLLFWLLIGMLI